MKIGRNEPCRCGSGKKYKKCHLIDMSIPPVFEGPQLHPKQRAAAKRNARNTLWLAAAIAGSLR